MVLSGFVRCDGGGSVGSQWFRTGTVVAFRDRCGNHWRRDYCGGNHWAAAESGTEETMGEEVKGDGAYKPGTYKARRKAWEET